MSARERPVMTPKSLEEDHTLPSHLGHRSQKPTGRQRVTAQRSQDEVTHAGAASICAIPRPITPLSGHNRLGASLAYANLILDQDTSSVDTRTERLIQSAREDLWEGRTTFVVAHRSITVHIADMVSVFDEGQIVNRDTHGESMAARGFNYDLQRVSSVGKTRRKMGGLARREPFPPRPE
jgi:ABC-type glutathione transport system ATPase component